MIFHDSVVESESRLGQDQWHGVGMGDEGVSPEVWESLAVTNDVTISELARSLVRIESKVDRSLERIEQKLDRSLDDHEQRLRRLERIAWGAMGLSGGSAALSVLMRLI